MYTKFQCNLINSHEVKPASHLHNLHNDISCPSAGLRYHRYAGDEIVTIITAPPTVTEIYCCYSGYDG